MNLHHILRGGVAACALVLAGEASAQSSPIENLTDIPVGILQNGISDGFGLTGDGMEGAASLGTSLLDIGNSMLLPEVQSLQDTANGMDILTDLDNSGTSLVDTAEGLAGSALQAAGDAQIGTVDTAGSPLVGNNNSGNDGPGGEGSGGGGGNGGFILSNGAGGGSGGDN